MDGNHAKYQNFGQVGAMGDKARAEVHGGFQQMQGQGQGQGQEQRPSEGTAADNRQKPLGEVKVKKRYQVFVSSTYLDLIAERQMVVSSVLLSDCFPGGMELFKSGSETWETIQRWIDDSDIYILILGGRYGSLDETGQSYTEKEFDYARSKNMPMFSVVLTDDFIKRKVTECGDYTKVTETKEPKKLEEFRKKVKTHIVSQVNSIDEIKSETILGIKNLIEDRALVGWVRADQVEQLQQELARLSEKKSP